MTYDNIKSQKKTGFSPLFIPSSKLISKQLNSTLSEIALAYSNQMTNQKNCYITKILSNMIMKCWQDSIFP